MPALTPNDAPKGTIAIEIRVIAPKTTKFVFAYKFPISEKLIIFAPKTRVGMQSGIIIIGVSTLALLTEKVKHEPKTAMKLRAESWILTVAKDLINCNKRRSTIQYEQKHT